MKYESINKDIIEIENQFTDKNNYYCIAGDFNAKSLSWDTDCNNRGNNVLDLTANQQLDIINDGQPTHRNNDGSESAIDLTVVSDNNDLQLDYK